MKKMKEQVGDIKTEKAQKQDWDYTQPLSYNNPT